MGAGKYVVTDKVMCLNLHQLRLTRYNGWIIMGKVRSYWADLMLGAAMSSNDQKRQPEVIEYVPNNRPVFNWKVILVLLLLWVAVVVAMVFVKAPMFRIIWPIIAVVLVGYLLICTVVSLRRR